VPYFLVSCTLPHTLTPLACSHQKLIYDLLFQTSADALQTLARNPKWLGGAIGLVGVLHTWDRSMGSHLHVHFLVPAGVVDPTTGDWKPARQKFLVPGRPCARSSAPHSGTPSKRPIPTCSPRSPRKPGPQIGSCTARPSAMAAPS